MKNNDGYICDFHGYWDEVVPCPECKKDDESLFVKSLKEFASDNPHFPLSQINQKYSIHPRVVGPPKVKKLIFYYWDHKMPWHYVLFGQMNWYRRWIGGHWQCTDGLWRRVKEVEL